MFWNWEFVRDILPRMLQAVSVTLQATAAGMSLALIIGLILALLRRSDKRIVSTVATGFVEFVRCTPLLVQLYFLFFILPLYGIKLPTFFTGAIGLGIHFGTFCSEVYRAGINAVPRGQWEAATALNLSRSRTWVGVILPQAIPPMFPMFGNYLIAMFKETAQLSAIGVMELLSRARVIGSISFRYIEPFTLVAIFFLILSYPSSLLVRKLEARYARQR